MRQLQPNETPKTGDWFFVFGGTGWIQLDSKPMPFKRMTIAEADAANKSPHFPIIIARPNVLESLLGTPPNWKPNQHKIRKNGGAGKR